MYPAKAYDNVLIRSRESHRTQEHLFFAGIEVLAVMPNTDFIDTLELAGMRSSSSAPTFFPPPVLLVDLLQVHEFVVQNDQKNKHLRSVPTAIRQQLGLLIVNSAILVCMLGEQCTDIWE